jgi:hypothetical protein
MYSLSDIYIWSVSPAGLGIRPNATVNADFNNLCGSLQHVLRVTMHAFPNSYIANGLVWKFTWYTRYPD